MYIKKILFGIVFILISVNISYSQSGWVWQNPTPHGGDYFNSFFINSNTGWVIATNSTVYKTTNSGSNWIKLYENPSIEIKSIFFLNTNYGWGVGKSGKVIKTTNSGLNWSVYSSGAASEFTCLYFVDSLRGYAAGKGGINYRTLNGGANWTNQSFGVYQFSAMKFTNAMTGYIFNETDKIRWTTNGGDTYVNLLPNMTFTNTKSVFFKDNSNWWIVTSDYLYATANGAAGVTIISPTNNKINNVHFLNFSTGYACGDSGWIAKTINGGGNWTVQQSNLNFNLNSIYFSNADSGFVMGKGGALLKTTNAGINWISYGKFVSTNNLKSVKFINEQTGWIAGKNGEVLKTTNAGNNWLAYLTGSTSNLNSIYFVNANTGLAVGDSGSIRKTTNGGINWVNKSFSFTDSYLTCSFANSLTGWIGGRNSQVFKTTNGGENWFIQALSHAGEDSISSISVLDSGTAYLVTSGGYTSLFKTTNGGIFWRLTAILGLSSRSSYFINEQTGWICESGDIVKTTNGGSDISYYSPPGLAGKQLNSIYFVNIQTGWCGGTDGSLFRSTNGGVNWTQQTSPYKHQFFSIQFTDSLNGYIVGEEGTILKTTTGGNVFISQISTEIPEKFSLHQNYPNPFNPSTNIKFDIHKQGIATLKVFDLLGKEMEILVDEQLSVGSYEVTFNANALPSGIYFYALKTGDFVESKKMVLVK